MTVCMSVRVICLKVLGLGRGECGSSCLSHLATPLRPPWSRKKGMTSAWATMMASESLGVTKKRRPRIMLRSASPSASAPKAGGSLACHVGKEAGEQRVRRALY